MMRRLLGLMLLPLGIQGVGDASTWRVTYDPGWTLDRVGQVVQEATSGDSIIVGPGTYYEHIDLQGKSLTIMSMEGPEVTVLDGSQTIEGRDGSVIYACPLGDASLRLTGFTLQGGTGSPNQVAVPSGGAVSIWNPGNARSGSASIEDCSISGNRAWNGGGVGGGVYLANLDTAVVARCLFQDNRAFDKGGSLCLSSGGSQNVIQENQFVVLSGPTSGTAVYIEGGHFDVVHNLFTSEMDLPGWGLVAYVHEIHLVDNDFISRNGCIASRVRISGFDWSDNFYSVDIRGNRFYAETVSTNQVLEVGLATGTVSLVGNTLVGCKTRIQVSLGSPMEVANNILFRSPVDVWSLVGGSVICNDAWPDTIVDSAGNFLFNSNVSEDPLLCDVNEASFAVSSTSVCVDGHSPAGCGWIGAGRIGCEETRSRSVSWGQIKALFRVGADARTESCPQR